MKDRIRILYKDRFLFYATVLTAIFFLLSASLIIFSYPNLPPLVPLFNSMPWGMMRLYSSEGVIFLPLAAFLIVLVNTILALMIYNKFTLLSRILTFNSFLFCLLGTFAYLQILFLIY